MIRTRCLFVLPSLGGGGAERVVTTLLSHLDPNRFDLHLAVAKTTGPLVNTIPEHVTLHDLKANRVGRALIPLAQTVRSLKPHVVFSTLTHMNLATALTKPAWPRRTRLVLRETNQLDRVFSNSWFPSIRRLLYRRLYLQADAIVCQTTHMQAELGRVLNLPAFRMLVIPNPVDFAAIRQAAAQQPLQLESEGPHIVALGRLRQVKGTDRLLDAFPALLRQHPWAQLWLLGDGPCQSELRQQASVLGIDQQVHFLGFQRNPYRWLKAANLMAVSSHAESCSNAILEAVACECPTVALRHPGGTEEMLRELGMADRFVPQLDAWHDDWFHAPPADAVQRAQARHDVANVVTRYEEILHPL